MSSDRAPRILQIEDSQAQANARREVLLRSGFMVESVSQPGAALRATTDAHHDLAIVHRSLSDMPTGIDLGETLRQRRPELGIILLSEKWAPLERRCLLERFADECLAADTDGEDLVALLKALCRRMRRDARPSCTMAWGPFRLDFAGGSVQIEDRRVSLQPLQLRLLGYFIERSGDVVTHEELRRLVFRVNRDGGTGIPRQICVLRRQLGHLGSAVETVAGGYRLRLP